MAGLEPHGEMLFIEIWPSWTLDAKLKRRKWQFKIRPFRRCSQVGQQVQIMHDAFHDDDDDVIVIVPFLFVLGTSEVMICSGVYDAFIFTREFLIYKGG